VVGGAGKTEDSVAANLVAPARWIDECVNERRTEICSEIFASDYVGHSPPHAEPEPLHGPDGYKRFIEGILHGFPDAQATIDDMFAVGDRVAVRVRMTGTHLGEYRGIPPTGRPFEITQNVIMRMTEGKIAESWQELDALGLMIQLGVAPTPGLGPFGFLRWAVTTMARLAVASVRARRA